MLIYGVSYQQHYLFFYYNYGLLPWPHSRSPSTSCSGADSSHRCRSAPGSRVGRSSCQDRSGTRTSVGCWVWRRWGARSGWTRPTWWAAVALAVDSEPGFLSVRTERSFGADQRICAHSPRGCSDLFWRCRCCCCFCCLMLFLNWIWRSLRVARWNCCLAK